MGRAMGVGAAIAVVVSLVAGCATAPESGTAVPGVVASSGVAASPGTPPPGGAPSAAPVAYASSVGTIPADMQRAMTGVSWRAGCPVALSKLRLVRLTYWGFDAAAHQGELIVHADVAAKIVRIFAILYEARFPIRKMVRIDAYNGSDDASMADDNTSMFNCRNAYGSQHWSVHAYGKAIDVNTVENPYLPGKEVLPAAGAAYVDRTNVRPGMIVAGDVVVKAFTAEGFTWGAAWKDYQHFEIKP